MKPLRVDEVIEALPELGELRPLLDLLISTSTPDPSRIWTASGELGTVGERLVAEEALGGAAEELAEGIRDHLVSIFRELIGTIRSLDGGDRGGAAGHLVRAAELEEARGRLDRAERYALAAHRLAAGLRDRKPSALALRRAARAALGQGDLRTALERYEKGYELARDSRDPRGAAEAAVGAGNVLHQQGRSPVAETWYRRALEAAGEVGKPVAEEWHAALCIHIVRRSRGRLEESLSWIERAEARAAELEDRSAEVFLENAWGQYRMARGAFEDAEEKLRRAVSLASTPVQRVTIRLNLAETLLARGRSLDAGEEAREAEREALAAGVVPKLPEVYRLLGRIAAARGHGEAFVLFERALKVVRERNLPAVERALTLQAYAEWEEARENREVAKTLRNEAHEIYAELGIEHPRTKWADVFAEPSGTGPPRADGEGNDG